MVWIVSAVLSLCAQDPQQPEKKARAPYGLPTVEELKEKLKLTEEQVKAIEKLYKEAMPKEKPAEGAMPKDGRKKREELVAKIAAVLTKEQQAVFKKLVESGKKRGNK